MTKPAVPKTALDTQVGGTHYKDMPIQHVEFCQRNKIPWCEAAAIKYLCRHANKNKAEDVKKAIHYCQLLLQLEYPEAVTPPAPNTYTVQIYPDGDMWCALLGKNLQEGTAGFGKTRSDALRKLAENLEL